MEQEKFMQWDWLKTEMGKVHEAGPDLAINFQDLYAMEESHEPIENFEQGLLAFLNQAQSENDYKFKPLVDIAALREEYLISLEAPGVLEDFIDIEIKDGVLMVRGEKKRDIDEKGGASYFFSERFYGFFERTFNLPSDAEQERITADFENGILSIRIGKKRNANRW